MYLRLYEDSIAVEATPERILSTQESPSFEGESLFLMPGYQIDPGTEPEYQEADHIPMFDVEQWYLIKCMEILRAPSDDFNPSETFRRSIGAQFVEYLMQALPGHADKYKDLVSQLYTSTPLPVFALEPMLEALEQAPVMTLDTYNKYARKLLNPLFRDGRAARGVKTVHMVDAYFEYCPNCKCIHQKLHPDFVEDAFIQGKPYHAADCPVCGYERRGVIRLDAPFVPDVGPEVYNFYEDTGWVLSNNELTAIQRRKDRAIEDGTINSQPIGMLSADMDQAVQNMWEDKLDSPDFVQLQHEEFFEQEDTSGFGVVVPVDTEDEYCDDDDWFDDDDYEEYY